MIKKILLGLLILITVAAVGGYGYYRLFIYQAPAISSEDRASVQLMPLPSELSLEGGVFPITKTLQVSFKNYKDERLERAVDRFLGRLSASTAIQFSGGGAGNNEIIIDCAEGNPGAAPKMGDDESYKLDISSGAVNLQSNTPFGALHGLETLLQLLKEDNGTIGFPAARIEDAPRFPWRGLMIDVCRHWMPKEVILRNLDAMAAVKLNVLHLHITEDQGFRIESKAFPKLHELGSNGKYYTQEDMKGIIEYAGDRGIRVVPEFDVPGHSKSWLIAYPELSGTEGPFKFGTVKGQWFSVPMDPTKEIVYEFLDGFFGEMAGLFPDQYLHIGGDEVNPAHWDTSEEIQAYMKENNIGDSHGLQAHFNLRVNEILKKHGKKMIGWDEILNPDLGKDIVIQSWRSHKSLFEGVQNGATAVLSAGYYLDHKLHAGKHYKIDPMVLPGAIDIEPDTTHWKMYDVVTELGGNSMESQLILFDRDPQDVSGFFALMDQRNSFKNGTIIDGELSFTLNAPMGELNYSATIAGDSLNGQLAFGLFKFKSKGHLSGGVDIAGSSLPEIEVMKPLTAEEKSRIIGGEACMWSELVSSENIDSRIWPRTAAIAEKFWSPDDLTNDEGDMYRRLGFITGHLTDRGVTHEKYYTPMLKRLAGDDGYLPLKTLVDILEEVKYYDRMAIIQDLDSLYLPDLPLDGVADAALPESMVARHFSKLVDHYIADPDKVKNREEITGFLQDWASNHTKLKPFITNSDKLKEIENLSAGLSAVSAVALQAIDIQDRGQKIDEQQKSETIEKLTLLETGENGVLLATAAAIKKLVAQSAP